MKMFARAAALLALLTFTTTLVVAGVISSATIGLTTPVLASATTTSAAINTQGLTRGTVGLQSDHAGTLNVQRYADVAGVVPVGAVLTVAVVAATPITVGWADGLPSGSFTVQFVNSAGASANLTNVTAYLSP